MRTSSSPHTPPASPPRRRLHRGLAGSVALVLAATGLGTAVAATEVTTKNPGGLVAVGPVNSDHGFPAWYEDSAGTRTELCLDGENPLCGFAAGDVPNPDAPISFPANFPTEAFYMLAGSELELPGGGRAVLVLALEAAFANEIAQHEDQVVFGRQRITVRGAPPDTTLTFTHPYGVVTVDTDAEGEGKLVEDISPAIGNFQTPLKSNIGPFLKWDPAEAPAAPEGYLGDPAQEHSVVGSPFGTNHFAVTGGGLDVSTDRFSLMGKISTNKGVKADQAVVNGSFVDVFASSEGTQLQVDGQDGRFPTTPMVTDEGSGRFYARIPFTGEAPTEVKVTNLGDKPASGSVVKVTRPSGLTVLDASYDGTGLTVRARSTTGAAPTLEGFGPLTAEAAGGNVFAGTFPTAAPPASVTVSAGGGKASLAVTVTDGAATTPGLPPLEPAPDPGPVVDPPPGTDPAPADPLAAVITPPQSTTVDRGKSVPLDGKASTGEATYKWTQVGGTPVTIAGDTTATPTVSVPYFTKATDTRPATQNTDPVRIQLVVGDGAGGTSAPAVVELTVRNDVVTIAAGARHRAGKEFRVSGTALLPDSPTLLTPATSVVVYDTTPGRPVTKLGTAQVDTLGAWTVRLRPGPAQQIRSVLVQSTRGGTATGAVATG